MTELEFMDIVPKSLKQIVEDTLEEVMCAVLLEVPYSEDEVEKAVSEYIWRKNDDLTNIFYRMEDIVRASYPEHNPRELLKSFLTDIMCERLGI